MNMNIKEMNWQELESSFNLACKLRDSVIMMARANNNMNTKEFRDINDRYNLLYKEVMMRLNSLYSDNNNNTVNKEVLND